MTDQWDPVQYLKFKNFRECAIHDLIAKIPLKDPKKIVDLGCGTGNSSVFLKKRWPDAKVMGVDNSEKMLEKAKLNPEEIEWVEADFASWRAKEKFDLIFSNAALHWSSQHEILLPKLLSYLNPQGVFAMQIPNNFDQFPHAAVLEVIKSSAWSAKLATALKDYTVLKPEKYYEIVKRYSKNLEMWETIYFHQLDGINAVFEWIKGSLLRPCVAKLTADEFENFAADIRQKLKHTCQLQSDGVVMLPFRRLFLVLELK